MSTVSTSAPPLTTGVALRLQHLVRLTDDTGIVQFATGTRPDLDSGYCVDDVARLGVVAAGLLEAGHGGRRVLHWIRLTLRFLNVAYDPRRGAMRNLMDRHGRWLDEPHHGDHTGRAIWALGAVSRSRAPRTLRRRADAMLGALSGRLPELARAGSRPLAYAALGLDHRHHRALATVAEAMTADLRHHGRPGWTWPEPRLTYDNARLPQGLLRAARIAGDEKAASAALEALDWYTEATGLTNGPLRLIGNRWLDRDGGGRGDGDEQPLDAAALAEALADAWRHTGRERYAVHARLAFAWFHGRNRLGAPLYDDGDGSCRDGLGERCANRNRGAESTLAYHQALLGMTRIGLVRLLSDNERPSVQECPGATRNPALPS